jgi:NADPH:quinone reductase-like Zn-dependent oxidoreductase
MRAVRHHEFGDPSVLRVDEIDVPTPADGEVLVAVEAASINPVDAKRRAGSSNPLPNTTGSDFAGAVEAVGAGVDEYAVGDRVFGTGLHTERFPQGSCAEYVAVPVDVVAPLPDGVSFRDAAAGALVGVTAWRGLVDHADLAPSETCLVHAGSGGVGHVAVQLADALSATVITTAGDEPLQQLASDCGADTVLDYDDDSLSETILEHAPDGVDVVFDHMVHQYLQLDVDVSRLGGNVVVYGGGDGHIAETTRARGKELTISMMSMSNLATHRETPQMTTMLRRIGSLLATGELDVEIARTYGLDEVAEAHRAVMEDSFGGKLVVEP